ncbi:glutamate-5-semialdehyde dehydrogenase [Aminipila luticellarii]|uniref:Gamma-glutamyl phosphate reductase n=1 Tax=Aminipila luticellarii TaxID=2507160 RepID=A0A410PTT4_9FIRM|nr:glutamate-5-semialdehyde dehydrogenase [Aminipila luticellarii]QAT42381.1 glutamate-5-semialdehyde dehydrogenase [Aminipila luticellarii]
MINYNELARCAKTASFKMATLNEDIRNNALQAIAKALQDNREAIFRENAEDMSKAEAEHLALPIINRLKFDEHKLQDILSGIESLLTLPDPLFKKLLERELDEGLTLVKTTCPIGVIGVIFESRPDALIQISTLCIKSGNCSILKGGSEAVRTNKILFETIKAAGLSAGLPENFITLVETRAGIDELIKCHESIDLLIPRGSNAFVQYIMANSKIPVMGHADGICHIYVDKAADFEKAASIIADAKAQYVAACNTVETLLVHQQIAKEFLPVLQKALKAKQVLIKGCKDTQKIIACEPADEEDFKTEYLDYIISVKLVNTIEEAIEHINRYGSHHTDCIITEDAAAAEQFMSFVDSAGVYQNCSTRFADGFRYGFGAEVGISTSKLHARGPVGLEGLVTYKYKLFGNGHIVSDYAEGKKSFHFKDK